MTAVFQAATEKTGALSDVDTAAAGAASALLIPAYAWMLKRWKLSAHSNERRGLRSRGLLLLAAGSAGAALSLLYGWLTAKLHLSEYFTNDVQQHFYSAPLWQQLIVLCMLTPVCEELLFRGLVFGSIRRKISGCQAAVLTSALFSVLHGSPIQMLYAFPMGLVLQTFLPVHGGRAGGTDSPPHLRKPDIRSDRVHPSLTFRINSAYICRNAQDVGLGLYKKERMLCIRLMK